MSLMKGKNVLIFGVANDKSIAYGIAKQMFEDGANVGFSYAAQGFEKQVRPIAERFESKFCEECDLGDDNAIEELVKKAEKVYGKIDTIIHSVAFAPKAALTGRFLDTKREDFITALNISAYTLVALAQKFEGILAENASFLTLTYYASLKTVPNYNVMGVAKAALEAVVRFLAVDLGNKGMRINAISAGPVRTLSARGVEGLSRLFDAVAARAPLHRNIDIEDCGHLASFLCSEKAKNITGEVVYLDAGFNGTAL